MENIMTFEARYMMRMFVNTVGSSQSIRLETCIAPRTIAMFATIPDIIGAVSEEKGTKCVVNLVKESS